MEPTLLSLALTLCSVANAVMLPHLRCSGPDVEQFGHTTVGDGQRISDVRDGRIVVPGSSAAIAGQHCHYAHHTADGVAVSDPQKEYVHDGSTYATGGVCTVRYLVSSRLKLKLQVQPQEQLVHSYLAAANVKQSSQYGTKISQSSSYLWTVAVLLADHWLNCCNQRPSNDCQSAVAGYSTTFYGVENLTISASQLASPWSAAWCSPCA